MKTDMYTRPEDKHVTLEHVTKALQKQGINPLHIDAVRRFLTASEYRTFCRHHRFN